MSALPRVTSSDLVCADCGRQAPFVVASAELGAVAGLCSVCVSLRGIGPAFALVVAVAKQRSTEHQYRAALQRLGAEVIQ